MQGLAQGFVKIGTGVKFFSRGIFGTNKCMHAADYFRREELWTRYDRMGDVVGLFRRWCHGEQTGRIGDGDGVQRMEIGLGWVWIGRHRVSTII